MSMTLTSSTRTVTVPRYMPGGLLRMVKQNFAKNYPLNGNMYVDYFNVRGGYRVAFDAITKAEYETLRLIFDDQLTNSEFLLLNDTGLGVVNESVFLNLPEQHDLRCNKQAVLGLVIFLEPLNADS